MKNIKLFVGIFWINIKSVVRRDRGQFKQFHKNTLETYTCKEFEL